MKKTLKLIILLVCSFNLVRTDPWDTLEGHHCTYLESRFTEKINKKEIKTIVELGSYNGLDAIMLHLYYKCPIFTFECDAPRLKEIQERIAPYPAIKLVPCGAWHETKNMTFYHSSFSGASSFYKHDLENLSRISKLTIEELIKQQGLVMTPFQVQAVRLDEWVQEVGLEQIDLLCIDVQGAALNALKGLGAYLDYVKYIITEVECTPYYKNEPLFPEIKDYLQKRGFKCFFDRSEGFNDVLFVREGY